MTAWSATNDGWRLEVEGQQVDVAFSVAADVDTPLLGVIEVKVGEMQLTRAFVDLETREVRASIGSAELAGRLLRDLPDDVREVVVGARRDRIDLAKARVSRARIDSGATVPTSVLYTGRGKSFIEHGTSFLSGVTVDGRTWILEQSICAKPTCECGEVFVHVEAIHHGGVTARLDVETGALVVHRVWDMERDAADRLLVAIQEQQPWLLERAARDYADIKTLGARTDRKAVPRKPSRNGPCPCGSGRRYKACCGR